jgi:hypothetical protein
VLAQGLDRHIGGHQPPPSGVVRFGAVAAVGEAGAVVLPRTLRQRIPQLQRRLRALGLEIVNAPWVDVDPSQRDLVVTDPGLVDAEAVVRSLAGRPHVGEPLVAAGRYPIRGWVFPSWSGRSTAEASLAAVLIANEIPLPRGVDDVRAAVDLARAVPLTVVSHSDRSAIVDAAAAALGDER